MASNYDLVVIGSGPGGYVAAIRAAQLGMKVGVVEKENLGGICLNWGCIPTKALLKSAQVYDYISHAQDYGVNVKSFSADFSGMVKRSREVANGMSKGINFLFKKNKVEHIPGRARLLSGKKIEVDNQGKKSEIAADHIILATGARARELPNLKIDEKKIIGYRQAMNLSVQPKSMVVIGSGAIGVEFAYFYNTLGAKVTVVEFLPEIVPNEDEEVSKLLEREFKKAGMTIMKNSEVTSVDTKGKTCKVAVKTPKGEEQIECEVVLSAVGIKSNIEDLGLEELGITVSHDKVIVDEYYQTKVKGIYAIGDIVKGPALAHVASHEGIVCVEKISGLNPDPIDYNNIPGCTYCTPEIASVGYTEKTAKEAGYDIKIGKFPFSASGKASAAGSKAGFVKVIYDAKYGEWLGAHMIGANVTELIAEVVAARKLETTGHEIITAMHPHPTMSEAVMEATAAAYGEVIHI